MSEYKLLEKPVIASIRCYNVMFNLLLVTEADMENLRVFSAMFQSGDLLMRDIDKWCDGHDIKYRTTFHYRTDFPLKSNLYNFYVYTRFKVSKRLGIE